MNSRLFKKFFLTNSAIFLAGLTFLSTILGFVVINYLVGDKREDLTKNCIAVCESVKADNFSFEMLNGMITALASTSDAEIFVSDLDGKVVACSCAAWRENGSCPMSRETVPANVIKNVLSDDFFDSGTMDGFYGNASFFTVARPIENEKSIAEGIVFSTTPASQPRTFFATLIRLYFLAAIIPIILMFFVEYIMSYRLIKPLRQMSDAAKRMAKGDFSRRIPVVSDDEIGELSISFNNMTNSLVQLESMRRSFIANVSHELRTPMTTIGGFIDGILDGTIEGESQKHYLSIVSEEVKRLSRLVESMLCLAKLESGEQKLNPQKFDIAKVARNIVVSQDIRLDEKNITVSGLDCDGFVVTADYDLIYQVIFNIFDNALKFTNKDGNIDFVIKRENGATFFAVRNTGSHIEREDIKHIFDRFYKADKSRSENKSGTGLGLYISKTIITIHGGKIGANSKEGEYTEFYFTLPDQNNAEV